MEYRLLKMQLYNIPWKELYANEFPRVNRNIEMIKVEDNYDDDNNYGLYSGDEIKAFQHAYATYIDLLDYGKEPTKYFKEIENLQDVLLQDIRNYLTASSCTLKNNRWDIEQLLLMLGETCPNQKMVDFVLKYWEQERQSVSEIKNEFDWKDEYNVTLDFPHIYGFVGDKVLYEMGNMDLAIQFYQLEILEWFEPQNAIEWQKYIAEYKSLRDNAVSEISFITEWREMKLCLKDYNQFYRIYNSAQINRKQWMDAAERFAFSFEVLKDKIFSDYIKSQRYDWVGLRTDFRACFMMALKVYNDAFLWEVLYAVENHMQKELQEDVINGVLHSSNDVLNSAKQYIIALPYRARNSSYERVFILLVEIAYVVLIQRILLERELKQDIGYYTSLDTFRYLLPERAKTEAGRLSVMHVAYMNDPNEGKTFWHYIRNKKDVKTNDAYRRVLNYPFVFLKCFTPVIDDLPMWEMYGNHAEGCCVILRKEWFKEKVQVPLYRVCYLRKNGNTYSFHTEDNPNITCAKEIGEYLTKLQNLYRTLPSNDVLKKCFRDITEQIAFLFKDANYQHEQELRIMYWYNESSSDFMHTKVKEPETDYPKLYVSPDMRIDIKEVILGPKVRESNSKVPYLQEEFEKLCQKTGYSVPEITLSEIEYR